MRAPLLRSCLLVFALAAPALPAQTVYRTVEDGVTSFSDVPPTDDRRAEKIVIDVPPPAEDPQLAERLEQMREATDRMADDRREREAFRAAQRERRDERARLAAAPSPPVIVANGGYWPLYGVPLLPTYPRPPLLHPPYRPQPLPEPLQPGWSVMTGGNEQLMRPIVSGKR